MARRWNGWGEEGVAVALPERARRLLEARLGPGSHPPDATFEEVVARVPASRLPDHPLVSRDPAERLRHARGQSLPDWVALRSGRLQAFPDGVAFPEEEAQVRDLLAFARQADLRLIPYGGGTSVLGHINPRPQDAPTLTVDLRRLHRLLDLDETSHLATFQAGVTGPALEAALAARGYTLGHFPQSFEYSTLGGWIATRSSGQQSLGYGRIEALFAGGHVETPLGPLDLPPHPASAAGPDLRHLVLGSEGRLGVITRAVVRVRPRPEREAFRAALFRDFAEGVAALRELVQAGVRASMLRLSDPLETEVTLTLAGESRLLTWAEGLVGRLGFGPERALLVYALSGSAREVRRAGREVAAAVRAHGGWPLGAPLGERWRRTRFRAPYLRNTLWDLGYALDMLETAVPWSRLLAARRAVLEALARALEPEGERALAFAHLSHLYPDGASLYVTFLFRRHADPEATLARWRALKAAATEALLAHGGTLSHHHGVGQDHAPYLPREKGEVGMALLRAALAAADPEGRLNPGKLVEG